MPKMVTPTRPTKSSSSSSSSNTSTNSTKRKQPKKRSRISALTCPVNGAGWCPYPFSIEQLEKRLKEKALAASSVHK